MTTHTTQPDPAYNQAVTLIKIQGIISIVFGSLGVVLGLFLMGHMGMSAATSGGGGLQLTSAMFGFIAVFMFILIPHAYLIASGIMLYRLPSPRMVRTFAIITMVIGFWNLILLASSIITLVQSDTYEKAHKKHPTLA